MSGSGWSPVYVEDNLAVMSIGEHWACFSPEACTALRHALGMLQPSGYAVSVRCYAYCITPYAQGRVIHLDGSKTDTSCLLCMWKMMVCELT
jgi:hypothetical protein